MDSKGQAVNGALPNRRYLPENATQAVVTVHRSAGLLRAATALAVLGLYAAIALSVASIRIARRDA